MASTDKKSRAESPVSPIRSADAEGRPESPTTAQPLDFDDDHDATTPVRSNATDNKPAPPPKDETPPTKPPRPISAREQAENTLREAFPTIEISVIRAVLTAGGGNVETAFNALLGMSDPDSQREPEPPARPPRPVRQTSTQQTQLEADEMYARQLAEHYNSAQQPTQQPQQRQSNRFNEHLQGSRPGRPGAKAPEEEPVWRSFIDDDLPEIRDNIKKGFFETQQTVNKWITSFKKTIDGEEDDQDYERRTSQPPRDYQGQQYGRRSGETRRSADLTRYDADPQVIGDDFSKLDLRDGDHPPRTSSRPLANPNLFKPSSEAIRKTSPGSGRKVSFQDGPPEEIQDMYSASSKPATSIATPAAGAKASKWQPLSKVDPSPVAENDPFSLGDSDDEKDAKPITMKDDDEEESLKKAMNEATTASIGGAKGSADETKK